MKCVKAQELFSSYLENWIEPPMRVALEQHFAECAECKAAYERLHAAAMILDELPQVEPPAGFHAAVMARVERARRATPVRVRWWNVDWQGVFNARVPVRAVAMGLAVLLVLAVVVQLTPLNSITANFLWPGSNKTPVVEDPTVPKSPLPEGMKQRTHADYARAGTGITIRVTADSRSDQHTLYQLRFAAEAGEVISLEVYLLPGGMTAPGAESSNSMQKLYAGSVSSREGVDVPVVVTRTAGEARSDVVQVVWSYGGRTYNQYLFLPPEFDRPVPKTSVNQDTRGASIFEKLNAIATSYGIVIMASGNLGEQAPSVEVDYDDPGSELYCSLLETNLRSRPLASSIYVVEPKH